MVVLLSATIFSIIFLLDIDEPSIIASNVAPLENATLALTCNVDAEPLLVGDDITWKHNGVLLNSTGAMLSLPSVNREHSGIYECLIVHVNEFKTSAVRIDVQCKSIEKQ